MQESGDAEDDLSPGWDAISQALDRLYPGEEPRHYGTLIRYSLGGPDPLDGLSAWKRLDPVPHWHIVTYGLSELYVKESEDAALSGYGFELTFRPACDPAEEEPPMWALNFLQNLARYVFQTGNVFNEGDWMPANGPIASDVETALQAVAFTADPKLAPIQTPLGEVAFRQVVGLTDEELGAAKLWNTGRLLETLQPHLPLLVSDLSRTSLLADPAIAHAIDEGSAREGSSTGYLFTDRLAWTRHKRLLRETSYEAVIGLQQVGELARLLPRRLPFGRALRLAADDGTQILFEPGARDEVAEMGQALVVRLKPDTARTLADTLRTGTGGYAVPGVPVSWKVA